MRFDFRVVDESGVVYEPWTDGYAVGFKATHRDGRVSYVYLNPSDSDSDNESNVFVYVGEHGNPGEDFPHCYVLLCDRATQPHESGPRTWREKGESDDC